MRGPVICTMCCPLSSTTHIATSHSVTKETLDFAGGSDVPPDPVSEPVSGGPFGALVAQSLILCAAVRLSRNFVGLYYCRGPSQERPRSAAIHVPCRKALASHMHLVLRTFLEDARN